MSINWRKIIQPSPLCDENDEALSWEYRRNDSPGSELWDNIKIQLLSEFFQPCLRPPARARPHAGPSDGSLARPLIGQLPVFWPLIGEHWLTCALRTTHSSGQWRSSKIWEMGDLFSQSEDSIRDVWPMRSGLTMAVCCSFNSLNFWILLGEYLPIVCPKVAVHIMWLLKILNSKRIV